MNFYLVSGALGLAAVILLISAIVVSYRVEARSRPDRYGLRKLAYTNIWFVALNIGVAKDEETQALRRKVSLRLAAAIALTLAIWPARMLLG